MVKADPKRPSCARAVVDAGRRDRPVVRHDLRKRPVSVTIYYTVRLPSARLSSDRNARHCQTFPG